MYTSFEDRLALLYQFSDGSLPFFNNMKNPVNTSGDGWSLTLGDSSIAAFNAAIIHTSRKEAVDELIAAIALHGRETSIRLVGPGINHLDAFAQHGYKNLGGTPFMLWSADNSVDDFKLRDGLSVRRLVPADTQTMCAIYRDVYQMNDEAMQTFEQMLFASENDHTYGLFKNDEIVSLVTAMVYHDTIGIWSMGTPTVHQKNGYGEQLLKFIMQTHKNLGSKNFFLHASAAGKFLYDKCGWITLDYYPYLVKTSVH